MKLTYLIPLLLFLASCQAQKEPLLLQKTLIEDLSDSPLYPRLLEELDGEMVWRPTYSYLDSIEIYSITYLSDGLKVNGFLVQPKVTGNYPCVIYNRGGNRDFGALNPIRSAVFLGKIAKAGYVVIGSQYRGGGGSEGQEEFGGKEINDVLILPKVLAEVTGADTSRIGMYGWSRGGTMTYLALKQMTNLKAAVVGGAVSDYYSQMEGRPEMETNVYAELMPDYATNKQQLLDARSAIKWADEIQKDVPILLLHGSSDWRVKSAQSLKMALEFEKHRIPYRLVIFEGGDHGITEHVQEVDEQVINWFDRFLKRDEKLPNMEYHGR